MDGIERALFGVMFLCFAGYLTGELKQCKGCKRKAENTTLKTAWVIILAITGIFHIFTGVMPVVLK